MDWVKSHNGYQVTKLIDCHFKIFVPIKHFNFAGPVNLVNLVLQSIGSMRCPGLVVHTWQQKLCPGHLVHLQHLLVPGLLPRHLPSPLPPPPGASCPPVSASGELQEPHRVQTRGEHGSSLILVLEISTSSANFLQPSSYLCRKPGAESCIFSSVSIVGNDGMGWDGCQGHCGLHVCMSPPP